MKAKSLIALVALAVCVGLVASTASAATISWGTPQWTTTDTEVVTTGTLVTAIADLTPHTGGGAAVIVNGVPFSDQPGGFYPGFAGSDGVWSPTTPATLSADYKNILDSMFYFGSTASRTLTIGDSPQTALTVEQEYLVQIWANFSRSDINGMTETIDGVTVHVNSGDNTGAGQYLVGTFTADAATQGITITGGTPSFAAIQVRAIPEPSTLALLAGGLFGLMAYAWRKRK